MKIPYMKDVLITMGTMSAYLVLYTTLVALVTYWSPKDEAQVEAQIKHNKEKSHE